MGRGVVYGNDGAEQLYSSTHVVNEQQSIHRNCTANSSESSQGETEKQYERASREGRHVERYIIREKVDCGEK